MHKRKILIVWNTVDRNGGFDVMQDQETVVEHVNADNFDFRHLADDVSGIVLSGTDKSPIDHPEHYKQQQRLFHQQQIPILAVCGAFQLMAMTFGATIQDCEKPVYGRTRVIHRGACDLLQDLPVQFNVFCKHRWAINTVPADLDAFAWSDSHNYIYGVKRQGYPHYGVQFHPERRNDGTRILLNFSRLLMRDSVT